MQCFEAVMHLWLKKLEMLQTDLGGLSVRKQFKQFVICNGYIFQMNICGKKGKFRCMVQCMLDCFHNIRRDEH